MKKVFLFLAINYLLMLQSFGDTFMKENFVYKTSSSNIIMADFPDPDVIRVDETYYMVSTTMHMMPGCVILRSYNLLDWEFCSYVFDEIDKTSGQQLLDNKGIYGKGMWAASLRYNNGIFYVSFVCNDTGKTYLYTSENIQGPWKKQIIPGFYHDMSILFDDNDRVFIVSGNMKIYLQEMESDFSGPKKGGISKIIIQDSPDNVWLGYEGSHFYKINGKYYIFVINMPKGKMRTETCFVSDNVDGPYTPCNILCSDLGGWKSGCAQGGIVQANDGQWYGILFQDHGALGRIPVLVPVHFNEEGSPVFENPVPAQVTVADNRPDYVYEPLFSNDFTSSAWQWNHTPNLSLVERTSNKLTIRTDKTVTNVTQAANTLSERTFTEHCYASVCVDGSQLNDGDFAGICALEGEYGFIALTKDEGKYFITLAEHAKKDSNMGKIDNLPSVVKQKIPTENTQISFKIEYFLSKNEQFAKFFYKINDNSDFLEVGKIKLKYTLDQFMGVRTALFCYSTLQSGGKGTFTNYNFCISEKRP